MIRIYEKNGKRLYEVFVSVRDQMGKQVARRKKGITSERDAKNAEYKFRRELEQVTDAENYWTWERWHNECIRRVKLTCKRATVLQYDQRLKGHLPDDWLKKELKAITTEDVYDLTFNRFEGSLTSTSRKILFMLVKRIFQMAVEEGILGRNPAEGIKLKREARAQNVLTAVEAQRFLAEAQATQHRFYPVWVLALKTGMRSGEMYALTWADVDFDASVIHINKQWTNKDGICLPKNREWRTPDW